MLLLRPAFGRTQDLFEDLRLQERNNLLHGFALMEDEPRQAFYEVDLTIVECDPVVARFYIGCFFSFGLCKVIGPVAFFKPVQSGEMQLLDRH